MSYSLNKILLRKRLIDCGLKGISDLAKRSGVHRNTIIGYLSGKGVLPSPLVQIAEALNVSPLSLITQTTTSGTSEIRTIASKIVKTDKNIAVVLIGSRAKGREKKYSDWDIAITGGTNPVSTKKYLRLKDLVEELSEDMPTMVDLVNLDAAPAWFYDKMDYEPVFLDGNRESFAHYKGVLYGIKKAKQD